MATDEANPAPAENPSSQFSGPSTTGERAFRRYVLECTRETANVQILHDTYTQTRNPRYITQVNNARANLEQATNKLRTTTDAPENMISRIAAAITAANDVLSRILPVDEGEENPPTPSVSRLNLLQEAEHNSAFRPIVPPRSQSTAQDAVGPTGAQDTANDQGSRDLLASPRLPATPPLRSATTVEAGHSVPRSRDNAANRPPTPHLREGDRPSSSLSRSSRHHDAAIAVGSARQERLTQRQDLRREIELRRNEIEQLQLNLDHAENLDRARRLDEEAEANEEIRVTLGDDAVGQWTDAGNCARTQPLAHTQARAPQMPQQPQQMPQVQPSMPLTTIFDFPRICQPGPVYMHAPMRMPMPYNHVATNRPFLPTQMTTSSAHAASHPWAPHSSSHAGSNPWPQTSSSHTVSNPSTQTQPPAATPPQSSPAASVVESQGLLQGDVATSLLTVNLRAHSRDLMVQNRPLAQKRFAGGSAQDLESFMTQFNKATNQEGVTDEMKFQELKFWTTGAAGLVVAQYETEEDSTEALTKVKAHLYQEFGRKLVTAGQMLDNLLTGEKFKESDTDNIQVFLLKLSQTHKRAIETHRESTFSTRETYDKILTRKLPFFSKKWAVKITDLEEKIAKTHDYSLTLTFSDFLDHCRRQNNINRNDKAIHKSEAAAATSSSSSSSSAKPSSNKAAKKVAATEVEVAATTTSRPKTNKRPSFPDKKSSAKPTHNPQNHSKPQGQKPTATTHKEAVPKTGDKTCLACSGGSHPLDSCREFLKMSDEERRLFVKKKGVCFLCLLHGHMVGSCPSSDIRCKDCNGRHNTVFHREKKQDPEES